MLSALRRSVTVGIDQHFVRENLENALRHAMRGRLWGGMASLGRSKAMSYASGSPSPSKKANRLLRVVMLKPLVVKIFWVMCYSLDIVMDSDSDQ